MNLNKVILMGRMTADPEIQKTSDDISVCKFTVAVNRKVKDAAPDFIECVAFKKTADFMGAWFKKGMAIIVLGNIQTSTYQDRNGNNRKSVKVVAEEVQFGEPKKQEETKPVEQTDIGNYFEELAGEELPF